MLHLAFVAPDFATGFFLVLAIGLALSFEFVNGFHDTANAVATVIYTHSLPPWIAVIWSGICNLTGVMLSNGAVAFGIVALLPVELVLHVGSGAGFAMVFALLISAIIWNVGTWYLGLPASSSHTLIGSIIGVGIANSLMTGRAWGEGINWGKAREVGMSLLVSPIVGFVATALLLLLLKLLIKNPALFTAPEKDKAPPLWIRGILVLTCTGVSFAHGSNDGQKGMGLLVLILVGILPVSYALNMAETPDKIQGIAAHASAATAVFAKHAEGVESTGIQSEQAISNFLKPGAKSSARTYAALADAVGTIQQKFAGIKTFEELPETDRGSIRTDIYLVAGGIAKLTKGNEITDDGDKKSLSVLKGELDSVTKYIPPWVKVAVALALGLGTMIGWKRIVVTVGEKIGKSHLTYGQGASAELVAMITIGLADQLGLPVSTTHVLSSGVAGAMAANRSGLQMETLRNLLLAWVLTLPVCVFLGSALFAFGDYLVLNHVFGLM
jgi:PiT family inorganic phosphate transporter